MKVYEAGILNSELYSNFRIKYEISINRKN